MRCVICQAESAKLNALCKACLRSYDRVQGSMADAIRWAAERTRRHVARAAALVAKNQPLYPDTVTGMRQQWVKEQIVAAITQLEETRP